MIGGEIAERCSDGLALQYVITAVKQVDCPLDRATVGIRLADFGTIERGQGGEVLDLGAEQAPAILAGEITADLLLDVVLLDENGHRRDEEDEIQARQRRYQNPSPDTRRPIHTTRPGFERIRRRAGLIT